VSPLQQHIRDLVDPELLKPNLDADALSAAGGTRNRRRPQANNDQRKRVIEQFRRGRSPYAVKNQPRDYRGRFRDILARLKVDLNDADLTEAVKKVEDAEAAQDRRDYAKSADAATEVISMVDKIDEGALNPNQIQNIRNSTRELGRVIAYLPLPQGIQNAKLRFSDVPTSTQQLIQNLKQRVIDKLDADSAEKILLNINRFMSGTVQMSSDDMQRELARMLSVLVR
jgi:GTP1/Obg family GTP-binding protein